MLRTVCGRLYRRLVGRRVVSSLSGGGVCCVYVCVLECVCFRVCISVYACMFIFMCVCYDPFACFCVCVRAHVCLSARVCVCVSAMWRLTFAYVKKIHKVQNPGAVPHHTDLIKTKLMDC